MEGCGWTGDYSCPWAPGPGSKGRAGNDSSVGYECCCVARTSSDQPCGGGHSSDGFNSNISTKCTRHAGAARRSIDIDLAAVRAAVRNNVDLIITCGASWSTEGSDRSSLRVDQDAYIQELIAHSSKVPVAVLLQIPGAVVTSSFDTGAAAIMSMFLAGQATGLGWADVLFGDVNPVGRLPVTFPKSESDTVEPCGRDTCEYTEGLAVGYRGLWDQPVGFPFGHGLSYTTFAYGPLRVLSESDCAVIIAYTSGSEARTSNAVCLAINVTNAGTVAGAEVVQLYLTFPDSAGEPSPALKGFNKTTILEPGGTVAVHFVLHGIDVSIWDIKLGKFVVAKGPFTAEAGASSRDLRSNATFTL